MDFKTFGFRAGYFKEEKLQCYFIGNPTSPFYESDLFKSLLVRVAEPGSPFSIKQSNTNLILIAEQVNGF